MITFQRRYPISYSGERPTRMDGHPSGTRCSEIFIEGEDERGKRMIWYQIDSKGVAYRHERSPLGVERTRLPDRFVPR